MDRPRSLFDKWIGSPRHPWVTLVTALVLLLIPIVGAYLEDALDAMFTDGRWRAMLSAPTIITYVLIVAPRMARTEKRIAESLRPLVPMDDRGFDQMVRQASTVSPRSELLAAGAGMVLSFFLITGSGGLTSSWLGIYWAISNVLMYGLLAWTIYVSLVSTRLTSSILRQPLRIDPLDTTPFEPIGRQSLLLALVFVGGITLSLLFVVFQPGIFLRPEFWVSYIPLTLVTMIIFFMSMQPTHRVLAAARGNELRVVQGHIGRACKELVERLDKSQDTGSLAQEINALVAYEQRLLAARTWPYNTAMLRTLFVSVLIPGGTMVGRVVVDVFFGG